MSIDNIRESAIIIEMECSSCGNKEAHRISYTKEKESCDKCGASNHFKFSDVYFKEPYLDQNITDPVKAPHGTYINSREHKAAVMKMNGIREFGDKRHGSRDRF